jgi:hypothetical protein
MSSVVRVRVGEAFEASVWRAMVLDVRGSCCIQGPEGGIYRQAPEGKKVVLVGVRVENRGVDPSQHGNPFGSGLGQFTRPKLITDTGNEYLDLGVKVCEDGRLQYCIYDPCTQRFVKCILDDYLEEVRTPDTEFLSKVIKCREIFCWHLSPGAKGEGDLLYVIPENELPMKLVTTYYPPLHKPSIIFEVMLR